MSSEKSAPRAAGGKQAAGKSTTPSKPAQSPSPARPSSGAKAATTTDERPAERTAQLPGVTAPTGGQGAGAQTGAQAGQQGGQQGGGKPADKSDGDGAKAGAVKAAQAALAAARTAAKKVQTATTTPSTTVGKGADTDAATAAPATGGRAPAVPAPSAAAGPREMHYESAVRFTGGAAAEAGLGSGAQPLVAGPRPAGGGPRRVRLVVSRIDPWSVMKLAFLLSVAIGIITVVATAVFWFVIDSMGVFTTIENFIRDAVGSDTDVNVMQFVEFDRLVSLSTLVAVINIVILTALATIMAIIYNIVAALVGGLHVTLTDD
jgi:hypothetical protein